ncbi:MAG: hypothetical protein AAF598_00895 [Bacteroidota bacterium]
MATRMEYQFNNNNKGGRNVSPVVGLVFFIAILIGFYYVTSLIWTVLKFLTPVMLIATAIIDYKVIVNYGKWIWKLGQKNLIAGVGAGLLSVIGIPVVSAILLSRALTGRKIKKMREQYEKQENPDFTDFEDLSENKKADEEHEMRILELEEPTRKKQKDPNQYDNLFEDIEIEEDNPKENLWD